MNLRPTDVIVRHPNGELHVVRQIRALTPGIQHDSTAVPELGEVYLDSTAALLLVIISKTEVATEIGPAVGITVAHWPTYDHVFSRAGITTLPAIKFPKRSEPRLTQQVRWN